jgi:hypothetical protein
MIQKVKPEENGIDNGVYLRLETKFGMRGSSSGMGGREYIEERFVTSRPDRYSNDVPARRIEDRIATPQRSGGRRRRAIPFLLAWKAWWW